MVEILIVSLGAILGANTRFTIFNLLEKLNFSKYIQATLINTSASFFLGLFLSISEKFNYLVYYRQLILFFLIGFLGSLSTFSSFVYEVFDLCLQFKLSKAINLLFISISMGIVAFGLGFLLGN
tara:strand:+ start:154 stop:525 length:372 start_codon:yes stop_codon:yes gene_type:complete